MLSARPSLDWNAFSLVANDQSCDVRLLITRWKRRLMGGLTVIGLNSLGSVVPFTFGVKLTTPTLKSEGGKPVSNQRDMYTA